MKRTKLLTVILLLTFVLTACSSGAIQTVGVSRFVPQTIEVTRIIPQTVIVTQVTQMTAASTQEPANETSVAVQTEPDVGYYNGIVVIAQYYSLFEHGLYEEAYKLLSPSRPHAPSLEEFIANSEMLKIINTEIITIRPYYETALQLQSHSTPDPLTRRMFYTEIYSEGESGMAGSVKNGVHTYFVTVILENNEWKIYSINTAPLP